MRFPSIFTSDRERQLNDQATRRVCAAEAVHTALAHPGMTRPKALWLRFSEHQTRSPLLAVVNIHQWPMPKHDQPTVRFLDINQLSQGKPQWLAKKRDLACTATNLQPQDSVLYAIPNRPHLKILCLTPPGWADCYTRHTVLTLDDDDPTALAADCIETTLRRHGVAHRGTVLTPTEGLMP